MNALSASIYSRLTGGTALTALLAGTASVYEDHAPDTASFDYVVFNSQAETWSQTMGEHTRFVDAIYQVKAVTDDAYPKNASAIDAQIDARLHNASLSVTGYGLLQCVRESGVQYSEVNATQTFQHCGALYRITLQKS